MHEERFAIEARNSYFFSGSGGCEQLLFVRKRKCERLLLGSPSSSVEAADVSDFSSSTTSSLFIRVSRWLTVEVADVSNFSSFAASSSSSSCFLRCSHREQLLLAWFRLIWYQSEPGPVQVLKSSF